MKTLFFESLFKPKYRIKKRGYDLYSGGQVFRYIVQHKYKLWPFWLNTFYEYEGLSSLEEAQNKVKEFVWEAYQKKHYKTYIYHTFSVPKYIPKEQEEEYIKLKERRINESMCNN